jgi:hypothetical protein
MTFGMGLVAASIASAQQTDGGFYVSGLKNNVLTAEEARDGYELLWNGKDFTGWALNNSKTAPGNPDAAANWSIVTVKGLESGDKHKSTDIDSNMFEVGAAGSSVFTKDATFLNFDYKVEWNSAAGVSGNAGLLYYYQIAVSTENNPSAAEYQLCNSSYTQEWKTLLTTAGCNYEMHPLLTTRKNPDNSPNWCRKEGSWNQSRIISYDGHVAHFGNGVRLLEYQKGTPEYEAAYKDSKYKSWPVYRTIHAGSMFIQDHGQKWMKFRNIRIKRLAAGENPWAPGSPYLKGSTLVDTLSFTENLFPHGTRVISPYMIVPKTTAQVKTSIDGLSIKFSEQGDYTMSLDDVRGVRYTVRSVRGASEFFLPGKFSKSPRILTIWKGGKKITETIVGVD